MAYLKALSLCASVAASIVAVSSSPATGKSAPILVQAPPEDTVTRHISYADLDLARPAGAHALVSRVGYAVNSLCTEVAVSRESSIMTGVAKKRCSRTTWDQARPQIDLALQRAREIAMTGRSSIAAAALVITVPQ